jgi:cytosine/uracil/thiamine/allantoin permease
VPGFLRAASTPNGQVANPNLLDAIYTYAWFVTFGLSFALYLVSSRSALRRSRSDATREIAAHS